MRTVLSFGMATVAAGMMAATTITACTPRPKELYVDNAWVRLSAVKGGPAAAYFVLHGGPEDATLISVTTDVAIKAEMHETMAKGTMTTMMPLQRITVPANADVAFAPGARHVMLFNVNPGIKSGSRITMTWSFANGLRIIQMANVIAAGDPGPT